MHKNVFCWKICTNDCIFPGMRYTWHHAMDHYSRLSRRASRLILPASKKRQNKITVLSERDEWDDGVSRSVRARVLLYVLSNWIYIFSTSQRRADFYRCWLSDKSLRKKMTKSSIFNTCVSHPMTKILPSVKRWILLRIIQDIDIKNL